MCDSLQAVIASATIPHVEAGVHGTHGAPQVAQYNNVAPFDYSVADNSCEIRKRLCGQQNLLAAAASFHASTNFGISDLNVVDLAKDPLLTGST